ncbi:102aeb13-8969-4665-8c35-da61afbab656 [Thermothielavioides terrestris]|uniref:102aeb13-8969-4665-8c35-da61afbab656 n=1 Tax=Thermothielavioides terrestris TaxID=2587410 RepID=A0A3S4B252_9PEZI|nr:102aeb13-8969-4665-8c35-da61afbab656 [Thermothielavioides terrestris]
MAKDKRSKAPGPPATASAAPAAVPPSWPPFKPALPVVDLALESLVQDKVVVLRSFFPRSLCKDYVSFLRELPLVTTPGKPKRGEALRVNDRYQIDDARFAHRLWTETGLKEALLSKDVAHDDSNNVTLKPETGPALPARTTWTLLLYLTSSADGCIGGETVFYPHDRRSAAEAIAVSPEMGMLLLHKHGHDCMLHEAREVTAGEKWVIRTDLCVRR